MRELEYSSLLGGSFGAEKDVQDAKRSVDDDDFEWAC